MAQSVPPGDIASQSGTKIVPFHDRPKNNSTPISAQTKKESIPSEKKMDPKLATLFINNTLERGVKDLVKEFRRENMQPETGEMKKFQSQNHTGYNRFKDVGCLDRSIVSVGIGPDTYIHANYVSGFEYRKKFICTQAPLDQTAAAFWRMIVQENSPMIVMLCNFKEQGLRKSADYFPPSITRSIQVEEIQVFCLHQGKYLFCNASKAVVMRRVLEVCMPGRRAHKVTHLQWINWPHRGVPIADRSLIDMIDYIDNVSSTFFSPIVVHCSAGIGRTGTLVLINLCLEKMRKGLRLGASLLPALQELRAQRSRAIQSENQYLFVHQVMLNYFINNLMNKTERKQYQERFAKFTADYEEAQKENDYDRD